MKKVSQTHKPGNKATTDLKIFFQMSGLSVLWIVAVWICKYLKATRPSPPSWAVFQFPSWGGTFPWGRYKRWHCGFIDNSDFYNAFVDKEFMVRWVKKMDGEQDVIAVNAFLEDDFEKTGRYKAEVILPDGDDSTRNVDFKLSISG